MVSTIWPWYRLCWIIQKSQNCIFEWSRAKKEVFGHFLEFGRLDRLDIAYCDRTKCFPTFVNVTWSRRIIQNSQKRHFEWSEEPKTSSPLLRWKHTTPTGHRGVRARLALLGSDCTTLFFFILWGADICELDLEGSHILPSSLNPWLSLFVDAEKSEIMLGK